MFCCRGASLFVKEDHRSYPYPYSRLSPSCVEQSFQESMIVNPVDYAKNIILTDKMSLDRLDSRYLVKTPQYFLVKKC